MISFDEEDIQTLVALGLSPTQTKIYLALISLGSVDAKKIAQTVGIDRGEVYRQLEALQEKGLIAKILNIPNQYNPINLKDGILVLIEQRNKESGELQRKAVALLNRGIAHAKTLDEEPAIELIPPNIPGIHHIIRVYENIHKEVLWYTPIEKIPSAIETFHDVMEEALRRGIRWRTIAELDKTTDSCVKYIRSYQKQNSNFDIRFSNSNLSVVFTIWDEGKGMNFYTDKMEGVVGSRTLTTDNVQLIKVVRSYFELVWNTAMKEVPEIEN